VGAWLVSGWVHDTVPAGSRRIRTSFGSVQVVASRWEAGERTVASGHAGAAAAGWSDRVVVLVEVRNDSRQLVRVAPGQFRLRVGAAGPSVDYLRAEPHGGLVAPGRVLHLLLTFAVSAEAEGFGLEYWEAGADGSLVAAPARVEPHPVL
jgi:hypothetical protein